MKALLSALPLTLLATSAWSQPDPSESSVSPWDSGIPFVSPGTQSGLDLLTVTVKDANGDPIQNSAVEIDLSDCATLCIDSPDSGLTGTTDANGVVVLDPRVGGCETCDVVVKADGVALRTYSQIISPDFDGTSGDGTLDSNDSDYIASVVGTSDVCGDLDMNGIVDILDVALFGTALSAGDENDRCYDLVISPVLSSVDPWDNNDIPLMSPGTQSGLDVVTVTVRDSAGAAVASVPVEIDVSDCTSLCLDPADDGLSGLTDGDGSVALDPRVGGCDSCEVVVRALGVTIATYDRVMSPDWDGKHANGVVDQCDIDHFVAVTSTSDECSDYNADGIVNVVDFGLISDYWFSGDANSVPCLPEISTSLSSVEPWDTYGHAFVVPGDSTGIDEVTVTVRDVGGLSVGCATVEIDFSSCGSLCVDGASVLSAETDSSGTVNFDPRMGGCESCKVEVRVGGFVLRTFDEVRSLDFDGLGANGTVDAADQAFLTAALVSQHPCGDYDGSGLVDVDDELLLLDGLFESNSDSCEVAPPDTETSSVSPWDAYGQAFVSPGSASGVDLLTVTVRDAASQPLPGVLVELDVSDCTQLCVDGGLSGVTDGAGAVTLDPRVGGCQDCTVELLANGISLRTFSRVVSPDFDGSFGNGIVDSADSTYLAGILGTGEPCGDYNGDAVIDALDSMMMISALGDANSTGCDPTSVAPHEAGVDRGPGLRLLGNPVTAGAPVTLAVRNPSSGRVTIRAYDVTGGLVAVVSDDWRPGGLLRIPWIPYGSHGRALGSGVYFVRLSTNAGDRTAKLVIVK